MFQISGTYLVKVTGQLNDIHQRVASFEFRLTLFGAPDNDERILLFSPLTVIIPPGIYVQDAGTFVSENVVSFEVETLNPIVTYNADINAWMVSEEWNFADPFNVPAILFYRTVDNPDVLKTLRFEILLRSTSVQSSIINENMLMTKPKSSKINKKPISGKKMAPEF